MDTAKLRQAVEDAIAKVNAAAPQLTPADVEYIKSLQQRMQNLKSNPPQPLPDGVYHGSLNSEYLRTLRDGLAVYRNVVLPEMQRQELQKLRAVADLAEALDVPDDSSSTSQDLAGASTGAGGVGAGPAGRGEPPEASTGRAGASTSDGGRGPGVGGGQAGRLAGI